MNAPSGKEDLIRLRDQLSQLVERFELDDPARGIVGHVQVVGGVFVHPKTRKPIQTLKVYGAGSDRVKLLEPRFLRSLPRMSVAGMTHPSHLCSQVAKALGDALVDLSKIRNRLSGMGIPLDLEHDVLRLRGQAQVQGHQVTVATREPTSLTVTAIDQKDLIGSVPRDQRTLTLTSRPQANLDELGKLVARLDQQVKRETLESLEHSLELSAGPKTKTPQPAPPPVRQSKAAAPVQGGSPASLAQEALDVLELTEAVETEDEKEPDAQPSLGAVKLSKLLDKLGSETEVFARGGRLHLMVPMKVMQGIYTFYLEQTGATTFSGNLFSPNGTRYRVGCDLAKIMDIKEVFDRVVLGK